MKKLTLVLIIICTISFASCNDSDKDISISPELDVATSDIGNVVPYLIKKENDMVTIGLAPFARLFYLNINNEQDKLHFQKLDHAFNEKIPVKVYLYENTNDIYTVKDISEKEMKAFLDSKENEKSHLSLKNSSLKRTMEFNEAVRLFNEIKQNKDIPFEYATDGCWARAHKMVQIINANGYNCEKYWMIGYLGATPVNKPNCCTTWGWHVAVFVSVQLQFGPKMPIESLIIDPSLFDYPATMSQWENACLNKQCNPNADIIYTRITEGNVYTFPSGYDEYDDDYSKTDETLEHYRKLNPPC